MKMLLIIAIVFFAFIFNVSTMTNFQAFGDNMISQEYPNTMKLSIQSAPDQLNLIPPQDRQIHLKFFDANTINPVGNVKFVMIVTKGNQTFLQNTFWTQSGGFTLNLKPGERYLWTANPDHDPMDGLYYSQGDQIDIWTSYLTEDVCHFSIQPVIVNPNDLSQQNIGGKFRVDLNLLSTYNETLTPDENIASSVNQLEISSPLKQFKSGIPADDVTCEQGLQLVIKAKDGSSACAKPHTAQKLVERKWGWAMQPIDSIRPLLPNRIVGLENNTGLVIFGNQTYYFVTPNYTDTAYSNPVQISFRDVVFTLFPPGFRGGLPSGGCGDNAVGQIVVGGGQYYWADAKFSDSIHESLHIFADSQTCPIYPKQTHFSNHTNPQAGLTFYDGKMKLLVNEENQSSQSSGFDGVIIDQSLSVDHMYYFFTNDTSVKFYVGSTGIKLEGLDHVDYLNGKHVKIFGTIPIHQEGEDVIKVEKFQILGSFVPKGTTPTNMIQDVSFDDLFSNPDKYYNQTITITGQLREHDYPLGIAGVGCHSAEFTTNAEFIPDFVSRHQLYDGERYIGVRIGGQYDVGYSESDKMPLDLKNKQVTMTGVFVPNIKDTGQCLHVLHKSGYILTDFKKISVTGN